MSVDDMKGSGFVSLKSLKGQAPRSPAEIVAELRSIYFKTSKQTIEHDFAHAIDLLKSLPDDETRDKAAVFMEGIAELRKEWAPKKPRAVAKRPKGSSRRRK